MHSETVVLRTAAVIFALICLLQLVRLITGFDVVVAGHVIPLWPNAIAFIVAGGLSIWMWVTASHHNPLTH